VQDAARADAVARQHALGKQTARERVAMLLDTGSFREFGALAEPARENAFSEDLDAPADGVVTGTGRIDGRPVGLLAFDFTVLGGSNGKTGALKVQRQARLALQHGYPLVMLLDGGGHRIQDGLDSRHFAHGSGDFFHNQARLSGWAPMVAAMLGMGFAGPSNYAALADFVVMVRGTATMGVAGPALVKAAIGEEISKEALGGAEVQADRHGMADLAVDSEEECMAAVRRFLGYFPSNCRAPLPVVPCDDPPDRREEALLSLVPENGRRAYDVRRAIELVADRDSVFELKPAFAQNLVTMLARLDGRPVGFIANQPRRLAGTLDAAACEKGAHFISLCDAFGLPLIQFVDVPGFMIGSAAEKTGLIRRSGRLLYELGQATVPRCTVILRKGYGLGYLAMSGGRAFDADLCVAWPTAEICAMSIEGAVDVAYRRDYQAAPDPAARRQELIASFQAQIDPLRAAAGFGIDDVIDPRDTRPILIDALGRAAPRRSDTRPPKYHGISPI